MHCADNFEVMLLLHSMIEMSYSTEYVLNALSFYLPTEVEEASEKWCVLSTH